MRRISAVLFDKDGTLLDFAATWGPATAMVLADLAAGDDERLSGLASLAGFDLASGAFHADSPIIAGDPDSFAPHWAKLLDVPYDAAFSNRVNALFLEGSLRHLRPFDDVVAVLDQLAALGLPVGLATNDAEASAHEHLAAMGIADRFAYVAGYDSGHGAKPGPGMVRAFAEQIGVPVDEVALVGDTEHDIAAAHAAGAFAIGIARDEASHAALFGKPDLLISDLGGLMLFLKKA